MDRHHWGYEKAYGGLDVLVNNAGIAPQCHYN